LLACELHEAGSLERESEFAIVLPLIAEALQHIAHPQIRNRGMIRVNLLVPDSTFRRQTGALV